MSDRWPSYWDLRRDWASPSLASQFLPTMKVTYLPNTGMEVGLVLAIEDALTAEGWRIDAEVVTGPSRRVDLVAWLGPVCAVIEVKRINAGPSAVAQLDAYLRDVQQDYAPAIGVLMAPALAATVTSLPKDIYFMPVVS